MSYLTDYRAVKELIKNLEMTRSYIDYNRDCYKAITIDIDKLETEAAKLYNLISLGSK